MFASSAIHAMTAALTHPCLVPYDLLPEAERAYDRLTVEQTLKGAVRLGCEIRAGAPPKTLREEKSNV